MDNLNSHNLVRRIFAHTGKSYDFVVKATTFWQDNRWKKRMLEITDQCSNPETILDLACGTGIVTFALARKFPTSKVVGIDLQKEYLSCALAKKAEENIENVSFYEKSAENTKEGTYDLITTSYLPKYVDLDLIIGNCSRMMKSGGLLIFHDFTYPENVIFKVFYDLYWLLLRAGLWVSGSWREMGRELRKIIAESTWVDEIQEALKTHGFIDVHVEVQRFEIAAIVYATKQ